MRSLFFILANQSKILRANLIPRETAQLRQLSLSNWLSEASGKKKKGFGSGSRSGSGLGSGSGSGSRSSRPTSKTRSQSRKRRSMSSNSVKHDKAANKFVLDLGNNQEAHIDYRSIGRNKLDLYHSEVPVELRGRGIGKALAKGALEHIASSNMKARLSCSYLADFASKSADPKLKKLVEK